MTRTAAGRIARDIPVLCRTAGEKAASGREPEATGVQGRELSYMIDLSALQTWCEGQHAWSRELLETLVRLESPSHDKAAVDRCGAELLRRLETCGARCARIPTLDRGDHIRADITGEGTQTLILGHFDTVWDVGQIERMPLRESGQLYGPASST